MSKFIAYCVTFSLAVAAVFTLALEYGYRNAPLSGPTLITWTKQQPMYAVDDGKRNYVTIPPAEPFLYRFDFPAEPGKPGQVLVPQPDGSLQWEDR